MQHPALAALGAAVSLALLASPHDVAAVTRVASFNLLNASAGVGPALNAGDTLFVDTLVRTETGALQQSVNFTLGAGVTSLVGQSAWMVTTAAGPGPRLIGFNVDLFNANTNTLIASDTFAGVQAGFAHSSFLSDIGPGSYRLVATGTGVRDSFFDLALGFLGAPPPASVPGLNGSPAESTVLFNVLNESATLATPLGNGDTLVLDSLVTTETGPLSQSITFTLATDVAVSGDAAWMVSTAAGPGPRLIGVNIDVLDASNAVVMSDTFEGVLAGTAGSSFLGNLAAGTYRLVATGNGVRDASLDLALSFVGSTVAVPEPETWALMMLGLGACGMAARRRKARVAR